MSTNEDPKLHSSVDWLPLPLRIPGLLTYLTVPVFLAIFQFDCFNSGSGATLSNPKEALWISYLVVSGVILYVGLKRLKDALRPSLKFAACAMSTVIIIMGTWGFQHRCRCFLDLELSERQKPWFEGIFGGVGAPRDLLECLCVDRKSKE